MKTKLEQFNEAKAFYERIKGFADAVQDTHHTDKFGATVKIDNTHIGYYGNSSCHSWGDDIIEAMQEEIKGSLRGIAQGAKDTARRRMEKAALEAKKEAEEVLKVLKE